MNVRNLTHKCDLALWWLSSRHETFLPTYFRCLNYIGLKMSKVTLKNNLASFTEINSNRWHTHCISMGWYKFVQMPVYLDILVVQVCVHKEFWLVYIHMAYHPILQNSGPYWHNSHCQVYCQAHLVPSSWKPDSSWWWTSLWNFHWNPICSNQAKSESFLARGQLKIWIYVLLNTNKNSSSGNSFSQMWYN